MNGPFYFNEIGLVMKVQKLINVYYTDRYTVINN